MVLRPNNKNEIISIIELAEDKHTPVIPRGMGTSYLGGAIPVRGGILVDLSGMNRIISLDEDRLTCRVETGVIWNNLIKYLDKKGYALMVYPTSALAATVGGWASSGGLGVGIGGVGIGSFKYGTIGDNISYIEGIIPGGEAISSHDLIGSDGILGIITEVSLKLRIKPEASKGLSFSFSNIDNIFRIIEKFYTLKTIYYVVFEDNDLLNMKREAKLLNMDVNNVITIFLEGNKRDVVNEEGIIKDFIYREKGINLGPDFSKREWEERFYPLKLKKMGPTIIGGEFFVKNDSIFYAYKGIKEIGRKYKVRIGIHGTPIKNGTLLAPYILTDERKGLKYLFSLSIIKEINDLSIKLDGKPYGVGLFNSFYAKHVHKENLNRLKKLKKRIDPKDILNPGKVLNHGTRFGISIPYITYSLFMKSLSLLNRL